VQIPAVTHTEGARLLVVHGRVHYARQRRRAKFLGNLLLVARRRLPIDPNLGRPLCAQEPSPWPA
jgi:hypothetical protein